MVVTMFTLLLSFLGLSSQQPLIVVFMHNASCEKRMKPVGPNNMDIASWRLVKQCTLLTVDVAFDETRLHWSKTNLDAIATLAEAICQTAGHVTGMPGHEVELMSDN